MNSKKPNWAKLMCLYRRDTIFSQNDWMSHLWKKKSGYHARITGNLFAKNKLPVESCPYIEGYYRDEFLRSYEIEISGLPF